MVEARDGEQQSAGEVEVVLQVEGMKCTKSCAKKIQAALSSVPGVSSATVNFPEKRAIVLYESNDHEVDMKSLEEAVHTQAGPQFDLKLLSVGGSTSELQVQLHGVTVQETSNPVLVLNVQGMKCEPRCAALTKRALASVDGVVDVQVDFENAKAYVTLAPGSHVSFDQLADAVETIQTRTCDKQLVVSLPGSTQTKLQIQGLLSKEGALRLQHELSALPGVESVNVELPHRTLRVLSASVAPELLIEAVRRLGFDVELAKENSKGDSSPKRLNSFVGSVGKRSLPRVASSPSHSRVTLAVSGMTCSSCVQTIENLLATMPGVQSVSVNLLTEKAEVEINAQLVTGERLVEEIEDVGYSAKILRVQNAARAEEETATFHVGGMTCSSCVSTIEGALRSQPGISSVKINLATDKAIVTYKKEEIGLRDILSTVRGVGYDATYIPENVNAAEELNTRRQEEREGWKHSFFIALIFSFPIIVINMVLSYIPSISHGLDENVIAGVSAKALLDWILATPVQFFCAWRFITDAYKALQRKTVGMSFLVAMGTLAAYLYGFSLLLRGLLGAEGALQAPEYFETSALLVTFILLGKYLEAVAKGKTNEALRKLMDLQVKTAVLLEFNEEGYIVGERTIPIDLVQKGDVLKVLQGAAIPADGEVVMGRAAVDESMLTGESSPVTKTVGDRVLGATYIMTGLIHMRVTGTGSETALSHIIRLVEEAQTNKAPIQAYADKISSIFVPCIVVFSLTTFIVWYSFCLTGVVPKEWYAPHYSAFSFSFSFGIATLVIACPCALGLASPTAVVVGTGVGARQGVLIKGGEPLEVAHKVTAMIFDKTGTLTIGKPEVRSVSMWSEELEEEEILWLAASCELSSEHPLGRAIVNYAQEHQRVARPLVQPESFEAQSGQGIKCTIEGRKVAIGNQLWMENLSIPLPPSLALSVSRLEALGNTVVYVAVGSTVACTIGIGDKPRPEAAATILALERMGIEVWMVTGDNRRTAHAVALSLGISRGRVKAEVLPSNKAAAVRELQTEGKIVAMVGDGINDSPALAQANLGIAVGGGTEIAVETAGMVLVRSKISDVITGIDLSRKIFSRIQLNYLWALGYNVLLLPLAAGVLFPSLGLTIPPMAAGASMAMSSVSVVMSSLLLRCYRPPRVEDGGERKLEVVVEGQSENSPLLSDKEGRQAVKGYS